MGWRNILSAKDPEHYEQKADSLCKSEKWGKAKIEYERALERLEKSSPWDDGYRQSLREKIQHCREALARQHRQSAADLLEAGHLEDARRYIELALELTADDRLTEALEMMQSSAQTAGSEPPQTTLTSGGQQPGAASEAPPFEEQDDDQFAALLGTLPEAVEAAYRSYGQTFKTGYLALNRGDFEKAHSHLSRALEEHPDPGSYIALELANACVNMAEQDRACELLETFLEHHPDALPAYRLLCEIFWETKEFERAEKLLASLPAELAQSAAAWRLRGETLQRSRNYTAAKSLYRNFLKTYGWDEIIARQLAEVHEALDEMANARNLYRQIMQQCRSCGASIDPVIKQKFADLCFASGINSDEVLEIYLSLAQEIPQNAGTYYDKVSQLYASRQNAEQARRFAQLAEKYAAKQKHERKALDV